MNSLTASRFVYFNLLVLALPLLLLAACSTTIAPAVPGLAELDVKKNIQLNEKIIIKPKSDAEIRQAYSSYLDNASVNDNSRLTALNRLAELEFVYSNKILKDQENKNLNPEDIEGRIQL